jgi:hypothetical protein
MKKTLPIALLLFAFAVPLVRADIPVELVGQCEPNWKPGDGVPGLNGTVYALTKWDPDGAGPQPELLVAGGEFSIAGETFASNIAAWNGNSWQSLGSGTDDIVLSLTVYNGQLIAGGYFATAGGISANHIAAWNGSTWQSLGSGMNSFVYALTVYNGKLIAGGIFTTAGGVNANRIAAWDGSTWQSLGSGMSWSVWSLTVYNGELIAGGEFTTAGGVNANCIARWNGSSWLPLGSGIGGSYAYVYALTVYNGQLIAGGDFTTAGGVNANCIATWNGSTWQSLVGGNGMWPVKALTVYNGQLIAGGWFDTAGGVSANHIASWNGSTWQPLGNGMSSTVYALTVYNGKLIAGGNFTQAGDVNANHIAAWDGSNWQLLGSGIGGSDVCIYALAAYNGKLIAGGDFWTSYGASANGIAAWNGSTWQPLGSGINNGGGIRALTVYNGELIAGGHFIRVGGVNAYYIAAWNGSDWHPLGSGVYGAGVSYVNALTVYNGQLIAGGYFTTAGGGDANYIAAWNGSTWQPLGGGMNSEVLTLTVYNGQLIAGGSFTKAGGVNTNYIATWNGSTWQPLGSGMNSWVDALTVYNGQLIAGGSFTTAGGVNANYIAAWNGSTWQPLGSGISGSVKALAVYNNELIAGGYFTTAGGISANRITRWNGSNWQSLGSGIWGTFSVVYALTIYNGDLIVGGDFTTAGGIVSAYLARWGLPLLPPHDPPQPDIPPIGEPITAPSGKNKLVVITHGWKPPPPLNCNCGSPDWSSWMENTRDVLNNMIDSGEIDSSWQAICFYWPSNTLDPWSAVAEGLAQGKLLAERIIDPNNPNKWQHVHLIAHSAGSAVISSAAVELVYQRTKGKFLGNIHLTFLDPYTPFGDEKVYGITLDSNDWADNYYNSATPCDFNSAGEPFSYARNVDLTNFGWVSHAFPIEWYYATITGKYPNDANLSDDNLFDGRRYGFPRSREAGESNWLESLGLQRGNPPLGNPSLSGWINHRTKAIYKKIQAFADSYIISSVTGLKNILADGISLFTQSPVWVHTLIDMPESTNYVRFTYQFNGTGDGYLTAYFNENLILIGDQRFDSNQPHDSGKIMVGDLMQDYNWLTFRLDPIVAEQANIFISNVEVGTITNSVDLNDDLTVNFIDFAAFANKWSAQDCNESNGWCQGCDFDQSGAVDVNDMVVFAANWLWTPPKHIKTDLNFSGAVDFVDFNFLANKWLNDCNSPDWCYGCDFDKSGVVDITDLLEFATHWPETTAQ